MEEVREMKSRTRGESLLGKPKSSGRKRGVSVNAKTETPRQRDLKQTICRTCLESVDPVFDEQKRVWVFFNTCTETVHRCQP